VCRPPAATATIGNSEEEIVACTGVVLLVGRAEAPFVAALAPPNCRSRSPPQHNTPSPRTAQLCVSPALMKPVQVAPAVHKPAEQLIPRGQPPSASQLTTQLGRRGL